MKRKKKKEKNNEGSVGKMFPREPSLIDISYLVTSSYHSTPSHLYP